MAKAKQLLGLSVACFIGTVAAQQLPQAAAGGAATTGMGGVAGFTMGGMTTGGVPSIRAADPLNLPQGVANLAGPQQPEPLKPNDFQKFVLETAGFKLPLYGQAFFDNLQFSQQRSAQAQQANPLLGAGFAPVDNAPVSNDYLLGPGDQVLIRGWGSLDIDVRAVIDRNGMVSLPRVGAVSLAGVKAAQAEGVLRNAVGKIYKDFQLSVTLGQLRSITVYVVGQARRPGSYSLSSMSTLASGLLATGGPNATGSMRRVELKRAGQVVAEFDLYSFLARGDSAGDTKLTDGDVIVIPPALGHVALVGKVNNPAVYELKKEGETLDQLLAVAGGLPVVADPRRVTLERLTPGNSQPRSVQDFALNTLGMQTPLKNGDLLTVQAITPELANAVTLRGNVAQPARLAFKEGMRIRDLIPNQEALISRDSVRRQNEALFDSNQRERTLRDREMIPDDLLADADVNGPLQQRDARSPLKSPATPANSLESFRDMRQTRSFAANTAAPLLANSIGNFYDEINWDYAVVERVNRKDLSVSLLPFSLSKALADAHSPDNVLLQAGDVVTVFSVNDVRVPMAKRRIMVRVEGEVANPGIYQAKPGETLASVLERAGGLTHDAYLYGSALYREEVRKSQAESLEKLVRRLEAETSANLAMIGQSNGASSDVNLTQARFLAAQQAQRQALERVRSIKPEGRIALGLEPELFNYTNKLPDLRVQNGDRFVVSSRPDFIYIFGSVNTESALLFKAGQSVEDYLKQAGVSSGADRDAVILIRADGSALSKSDAWFGATINSAKVMPGDTIVLPEKLDREATWSVVMRNTKDITQIFYQLGLGAAALKTLRN
ncbi:SLBB domain-containing protein [Limnohabitans sp.]|uniref:SLBB domain-containing protein n=1 Tax=Limnohabitans sp. TaxID=1907725 RepID=UPI0038BD8058